MKRTRSVQQIPKIGIPNLKLPGFLNEMQFFFQSIKTLGIFFNLSHNLYCSLFPSIPFCSCLFFNVSTKINQSFSKTFLNIFFGKVNIFFREILFYNLVKTPSGRKFPNYKVHKIILYPRGIFPQSPISYLP